MTNKHSVLFIGKSGDFYCDRAVEFMRLHFPDNTILLGRRGENEVDLSSVFDWRGDYIISYLSPWIIPEFLLIRADQASINFHTGSPEYPGIGCVNFALYDEVDSYGITCHYMEKKVDTGKIIDVSRFPLYSEDTVYSLTQRCYGYMLVLFYDIMADILSGNRLPESHCKWSRKPYTRNELDALCEVARDMDEDEVKRRERAVTFGDWGVKYVEEAK